MLFFFLLLPCCGYSWLTYTCGGDCFIFLLFSFIHCPRMLDVFFFYFILACAAINVVVVFFPDHHHLFFGMKKSSKKMANSFVLWTIFFSQFEIIFSITIITISFIFISFHLITDDLNWWRDNCCCCCCCCWLLQQRWITESIEIKNWTEKNWPMNQWDEWTFFFFFLCLK